MASRLESGSAGRLKLLGWLAIAFLAGLLAASPAGAETFTNPDPVVWNAAFTPKPWEPYPSTVEVPPTAGTVGAATVTFHGFRAGNLGYMNFMLVGPQGERVILASDMSYSAYGPNPFDLGFADNGTTYPEGLPYVEAGVTLIIKPVNNNQNNDSIWTAPAPSAIGATTSLATAFEGIDPSGTWSLYGMGNGNGAPVPVTDVIASGWSLNLDIVPNPPDPPPVQPPAGDPVPQLSGLTVTPTSFRAANIGGSTIAIGSRRRAPVGATVLFSLSADGTAYFKARRLVRGFRKKRRCVAAGRTPKKMRGRKCTRSVPVKGGFRVTGESGLNGFTFTGRVRKRPLRPGRYKLIARASADGLAFSAPLKAKFRIRK